MLMTGKVKDEATMDMFGDTKKKLLHMRKELYWQEVMAECDVLLDGLTVYDDLPSERFGKWVKEQLSIHVRWAFHEVWNELSKGKEGEKHVGVDEAAKRVVYRYVTNTHMFIFFCVY